MRLALLSQLVGIDLPCRTWNRARRAPLWSRMPHRLRDGSGHGLWGIQGLYGKDLIITKLGNIQLRRVVQLIQKLIKNGIAGYLENPLTSLIWSAIDILLKQEIRKGLVVFVDTDMCAHGTAWKKSQRD